MFTPADFFDLAQTEHTKLFKNVEFVWEALRRIEPYLANHLRTGIQGEVQGAPQIGPQVYIGPGTRVAATATIVGPAWIGRDCEIRPGAFIRENAIIGDGCLVGNACEVKNSLLFNGAQVPHFSYVGDSILGARAHLGAGVILSNLKLDNDLITIHHDGKSYPTGLRKFGAIIGDAVEIGCNAVINPGSLIGQGSILYPGVVWRGILPRHSIVKGSTTYHVTARRMHPSS